MNRSRGLLAIATSVALFGCTRGFTSPRQLAHQPAGTACADPSSCASGQCVDGVCCQTACAESQRCDAPGHVGSCTERALGEGCDAGAQCPTGRFCVEGVCCQTACDGTCESCTVPGSVGSCVPVPDNTDPRRDCAAQSCSACFGGRCAPALPDTDPDQSCTDGKRCSVDQRCGVTDGGPCSSNDECATGRCLAGACLYLDDEAVSTPSMNPYADARDVAGAAADAEGDVAVLFTESQNLFPANDVQGGAPVENDVFLALRPAGGAWAATRLFTYSDLSTIDLLPALGRVVFLGRQPLAITQREPDSRACSAALPCGVFAVTAAATGEVGRFEPVDADAQQLEYLDAVVDTAGRVSVVYADSRGIHVRQRQGDGSWVVLSDLADLAGLAGGKLPAIQAVGTDLYLVYPTDPPGAGVAFVDGGGAQLLAVGQQSFDCGAGGELDVESAKGPARPDLISMAALCDVSFLDPFATSQGYGAVYRLQYTPGSPPTWSVDQVGSALGSALLSSDGEWSAEVHPQSSLSDYGVIGLAWLKPNGNWSAEDQLKLVVSSRPWPSLAVSGDGELPVAAYGLDSYDTADTSSLTEVPAYYGSELHAVSIRR